MPISRLIISRKFEDDEITTINTDLDLNNIFLNNVPNSGSDGHIHYYVNGILTPYYTITSTLLPNLANGEYEVIVALFDNLHQPIYPYVADTVIFSVNLINGCTDSSSCNYDPNATCDDGSCYGAIGCTDPLAITMMQQLLVMMVLVLILLLVHQFLLRELL